MLTLVVPTLWKFPPFLDFVEDVLKVPTVGEVIIVDNDPTHRPEHAVLYDPRVTLKDDENLYVNRAWNWGVAHSKHEQICIINDDMVVDLKLFFKVGRFVTPDFGLTGLCPGHTAVKQEPLTSGTIRFRPWNRDHTLGFGSLFFVHRDNWIPIPHELQIYYGDNWAFDTQLILGRQNILALDCLHFTPWAATTSTINPKEWLYREKPIFDEKIAEFRRAALTLS